MAFFSPESHQGGRQGILAKLPKHTFRKQRPSGWCDNHYCHFEPTGSSAKTAIFPGKGWPSFHWQMSKLKTLLFSLLCSLFYSSNYKSMEFTHSWELIKSFPWALVGLAVCPLRVRYSKIVETDLEMIMIQNEPAEKEPLLGKDSRKQKGESMWNIWTLPVDVEIIGYIVWV